MRGIWKRLIQGLVFTGKVYSWPCSLTYLEQTIRRYIMGLKYIKELTANNWQYCVERLIISDLDEQIYNTIAGLEILRQYRDMYFANGMFDYVFEKYIKDHKLT